MMQGFSAQTCNWFNDDLITAGLTDAPLKGNSTISHITGLTGYDCICGKKEYPGFCGYMSSD